MVLKGGGVFCKILKTEIYIIKRGGNSEIYFNFIYKNSPEPLNISFGKLKCRKGEGGGEGVIMKCRGGVNDSFITDNKTGSWVGNL